MDLLFFEWLKKNYNKDFSIEHDEAAGEITIYKDNLWGTAIKINTFDNNSISLFFQIDFHGDDDLLDCNLDLQILYMIVSQSLYEGTGILPECDEDSFGWPYYKRNIGYNNIPVEFNKIKELMYCLIPYFIIPLCLSDKVCSLEPEVILFKEQFTKSLENFKDEREYLLELINILNESEDYYYDQKADLYEKLKNMIQKTEEEHMSMN